MISNFEAYVKNKQETTLNEKRESPWYNIMKNSGAKSTEDFLKNHERFQSWVKTIENHGGGRSQGFFVSVENGGATVVWVVTEKKVSGLSYLEDEDDFEQYEVKEYFTL